MRHVSVLALAAALCGVASAQPEDSAWVSYYNNIDGWFAFQGPLRAMRFHPADFGLEHPIQLESLRTWWYDGMGSFGDSTFRFFVYAGNGSTLLWQSETLKAPRGNQWTRIAMRTPLVIDSGDFWMATWHREVSPYAHPYVNVDDNSSPTHSYYGSPGAWTLDNVGEFSFLVWVREVTVGLESGRWAGFEAVEAGSTVVQGALRLPGSDGAAVLDATGRRVSSPGALRTGVYFVVSGSGVRRVAVVR